MIQLSVSGCLQHYLRTVQVVVTGTVYSICMIALDGAIQKKSFRFERFVREQIYINNSANGMNI